MNNFTKFYFIALIALLLFSFLYGLKTARVCYDGVRVDREKLMRDCKVTLDEYWKKIEENPNFCPEARESIQMIGGCDRLSWDSLGLFILVMLIIYNIFYFLFYLLIKFIKRLKRKKS